MKKSLWIKAIIFFVVMTLAQCTTLSKKQCLQSSWYDIGLFDGIKGLPQTRIKEHEQACLDYGISPKVEEYAKGYQEGLQKYCMPQNGFKLGKTGQEYQKVCPENLEPEFMKQFQIGQKMYQTLHRVTRIFDEMAELESKLGIEKDEFKRGVLKERLDKLSQEREILQARLVELEQKKQEVMK